MSVVRLVCQAKLQEYKGPQGVKPKQARENNRWLAEVLNGLGVPNKVLKLEEVEPDAVCDPEDTVVEFLGYHADYDRWGFVVTKVSNKKNAVEEKMVWDQIPGHALLGWIIVELLTPKQQKRLWDIGTNISKKRKRPPKIGNISL